MRVMTHLSSTTSDLILEIKFVMYT